MLLLWAALAHAEPVTGYADLHIHIAANLAVPIYGESPEAPLPAETTWRHALRPQIFADDLAGPTLYVSLAYANPFSTVFESHASMRARIERQLDEVEAFCAHHADRFGLAHTPDEARAIIASGRAAIVHGIEGATKILSEPGDAARWAARGVAVVTPIHLADNEVGGALCQPGVLVLLNVPGCLGQAFAPRHTGLTPRGVTAVTALLDAGIVLDLAHTSPQSFGELLPILAAHHAAPVYTHATATSVTHERATLSDAQIDAIASLGGLIAVTANARTVAPRPAPSGIVRCPGSVDDLRLHWDHIAGRVAAFAAAHPGEASPAVAWGSDFQGGISHLRPRYGPDGCADTRPDGAPLTAFDVEGLSRPGLVDAMFADLAAGGMDRAPLDTSAERFLEIWEAAR